MSFNFNYNLWVSTQKDIKKLLARQNFMKKLEPVQDPKLSFKIFSEMYVLYADLVSKLNLLYSMAYQVQKRHIIRTLLESATKRLMELKDELKTMELSEYVYMDKTLIANKMTPYDLMIWRSPQFLYRRPPELENLLIGNRIQMTEEQKAEHKAQQSAKRIEALILIQAHEKARQARVYKAAIKYDRKNLIVPEVQKLRYKFTADPDTPMSLPVKRTVFTVNFIHDTDDCADMLDLVQDVKSKDEDQRKSVGEDVKDNAARVIQRAWQVYKARTKFKLRAIKREIMYGTRMKRRIERPDAKRAELIKFYEAELRKREFDEQFLRLMSSERVRLLQQRSVNVLEDISEHIRAWFREFYDKTGNFHPFPDALKKGTVLVLIDETMPVEEFRTKLGEMNLSKEEKKKRAEKERERKKKEKEKQKKEELKIKKRLQKQKAAGVYDVAFELQTNENVAKIEKTMRDYSNDWHNIDEFLNKYEPIKGWVTDSEMAKIHRELRALVDEFMRIEYELLRKALAEDEHKKYKPTKPKKEKKGKRKGKKEPSDMTADRTLESLYEEMKEAGIIEPVPNLSFDDFFGDFNFVADDTRDMFNLTTLPPSKADIKMVIQECLLGMGELNVDKPKSLCIIGPYNNGKKLLCKIIASELDAIFIDLSPEKTGAFAEDLKYFVHVIMKIARAFQPTILFIPDVHRVFWKKVPKDQVDLNPRLLEKVLAKQILKPIKKTDKIMLLGTSDMPWSAKAKIKKVFQRFLLIPKNDYGSSLLLWLELMAKYANLHGVADYAISALAKTMQEYNSGEIFDTFEKTLSVERRARLMREKLNPFEFLDTNLDATPPVLPTPEKIILKFEKWYNRANKLAKQRNAFLKKQKSKDKKK